YRFRTAGQGPQPETDRLVESRLYSLAHRADQSLQELNLRHGARRVGGLAGVPPGCDAKWLAEDTLGSGKARYSVRAPPGCDRLRARLLAWLRRCGRIRCPGRRSSPG